MFLFECFFVFTIGAFIGSFLNVVAIRAPKGKNVSYPASHCMSCKRPLKYYHNIPVISWIALSGKCAYCESKISIQYPIVEAAVGLIFLSIYLKYGIYIEAMAASIVSQ